MSYNTRRVFFLIFFKFFLRHSNKRFKSTLENVFKYIINKYTFFTVYSNVHIKYLKKKIKKKLIGFRFYNSFQS